MFPSPRFRHLGSQTQCPSCLRGQPWGDLPLCRSPEGQNNKESGFSHPSAGGVIQRRVAHRQPPMWLQVGEVIQRRVAHRHPPVWLQAGGVIQRRVAHRHPASQNLRQTRGEWGELNSLLSCPPKRPGCLKETPQALSFWFASDLENVN